MHTAMAETPSAESIVREFWRLMATNDFHSVKAVLAQGFVMDWPQSQERIRGSENFARMNAEYPTTGRWEFQINRLVASSGEVVTQVSVTDGTQSPSWSPSSPSLVRKSRASWSTGQNRSLPRIVVTSPSR